jgi:hypothetical protein
MAMDRRDRLPAELAAALAGEDVEELIAEARADARAAVKLRLQEELEDALLDSVRSTLTRPVPAPEPERGEGVWLYGVAADDHPGPGAQTTGVAGPPQMVRAAGLAALVSRVPLEEFGEDALKRNLNDLAWLESMARAHEAVLEAALARGTVVPMRVCTIYRGEEQVQAMLAERQAEFAGALDSLANRAEWGVKAFAAPAEAVEVTSGEEDGGSYLTRKQELRRERERRDALVDEAAREAHARLEEWAAASKLLPPQRREVAGYEGEMILNAAYLVDDERVGPFCSIAQELGDQYSAGGISVEITGPWPAYHFVSRLESPREQEA